MNPRRATIAVLCLACLLAIGGNPRGMIGLDGGGRTLILSQLEVGAALIGQDIGMASPHAPGNGIASPIEALTTVGAAYAAPAGGGVAMAPDAGNADFWGEYQGYLADPDGHVWSGEQR